MSFEANLTIEKRAKNVITWSGIYLVTSWLSVVGELLNPDSSTTKISDLLYLPVVPALIIAFVITWRWLRSLMITAYSIDSTAIGYRQGWAFWGWITPIASWWIPRRLLDGSHAVFTSYAGLENTLRLGSWWGLFVASSIIDNLSFRASFSGNNSVVVLNIVSEILMTIAFPKWKVIVQTVSNSQHRAIARMQTEAA